MSTEIYPITPSLVFIEFCVNDSEAGAQTNGEALIRAIRTNLPNTNIAMIFFGDYTSPGTDLTNLHASTLQVYHDLCEHYSIPYVDMNAELARAIGASEYIITNYTTDFIHPTTFGGARAAELLQSIITSSLVLGGTQTGALPDPLYP